MVEYSLNEEETSAVSIDFHTQWKQEKIRAGVKLELKVAQAILVYNMLQDMRHLVIIDFRPNYNECHIRKSVPVDMDNYRKVLLREFAAKKNDTLYQGDDLRRILFVFPAEESTHLVKQIGVLLNEIDLEIFTGCKGLTHIHKAYFLKDFDTEFKTKYHFMCLPQKS